MFALPLDRFSMEKVDQHHIQCPSDSQYNCTSGSVTEGKCLVASGCCCGWCTQTGQWGHLLKLFAVVRERGSLSLADSSFGSSTRSGSWACTSLRCSISRILSSIQIMGSILMTFCNPLAALHEKIYKKMPICIVKVNEQPRTESIFLLCRHLDYKFCQYIMQMDRWNMTCLKRAWCPNQFY